MIGALASRAASSAVFGQMEYEMTLSTMFIPATTVEEEVTWRLLVYLLPSRFRVAYVDGWDGIAVVLGVLEESLHIITNDDAGPVVAISIRSGASRSGVMQHTCG